MAQLAKLCARVLAILGAEFVQSLIQIGRRCSARLRMTEREPRRELVESARAVTKNVGNDVHIAGNLFPET